MSVIKKALLIGVISTFSFFPDWAMADELSAEPETAITNNSESVASFLTAVGQRLERQPAQSTISGIAAQEASNELSGWLNQYGTARIDLSTDHAFSLKHSSADVLFPVFEGESNLLFSQFGLHNNEDRFTTNAGLGQRWFVNDWMLGYNAFYDLGWRNTRQRYGLGLEVWRDFAKLSANSYQAISGWRESRQHEDYDERPASGWDMQAEGWVPFWPWLGGRVMYERYQGDEVALTSFSQRGKNPSATTLGLNYTPVPLLTLGVDRKQQTSRNPDTSVKINLNWRVGQPLHKQISADEVVFNRLLTGSRLELVSRNNALVMDYRKPSLLSVRFPAEIRATEMSEYTFIPDVNSRHRIAKTELDDAALIAAGGKIIRASEQGITLQLPAAATRGAVVLSGTLIDIKGNRSNTAHTLIHPMPGDTQLTLDADHLQAVADGLDELTFTATLQGPGGKPDVGRAVEWKTDFGELTVRAPVTNARGMAQATLRSRTPGSAQVTATAGGKMRSAPIVRFVADTALRITLAADKESAPASGESKDAITFTAQVTRKNGAPASAETVNWSTDAGTLSAQRSLTNNEGIATVSLIADSPGIAHVSATTASGETARHQVAFLEQLTWLLTMTADNLQAIANGEDDITFTATLQSSDGKPGVAVPVHWKTDFGDLTARSSVTDTNGTAQATLRSSAPGSANVVVTVGEKTLAAPRVEFVTDTAINISLEADKETAPASGYSQDAILFTARLTRKDGGPATGETVSWSADAGSLSARSTVTNNEGVATVALTADSPGTVRVTATAAGGEMAQHKVSFFEHLVLFLQGDSECVMTNDPDGLQLILFVQNKDRDPLSGIPATWTTNTGNLSTHSTITDGNGMSYVRLNSHVPGPARVTVDVKGNIISYGLKFVDPEVNDCKLRRRVVSPLR
ncbi:inverse autotransporter beta domain-containing protein [Enterobacter sp.]|uniref:inverse autotransporter beta domain-containing protein n=1 Tax=Enterobacter sp. TaxID=42895 RepID=UPI00296F202A|nr:inverse autotransporter beta domain-containing protein [Enterobacter sp.]